MQRFLKTVVKRCWTSRQGLGSRTGLATLRQVLRLSGVSRVTHVFSAELSSLQYLDSLGLARWAVTPTHVEQPPGPWPLSLTKPCWLESPFLVLRCPLPPSSSVLPRAPPPSPPVLICSWGHTLPPRHDEGPQLPHPSTFRVTRLAHEPRIADSGVQAEHLQRRRV